MAHKPDLACKEVQSLRSDLAQRISVMELCHAAHLHCSIVLHYETCCSEASELTLVAEELVIWQLAT